MKTKGAEKKISVAFDPSRLKLARARRGMSIRELAKQSGVAQDTITDAERGIRQPWARTLYKLAKALDCEVDEFFVEEKPLITA